MNSCLKYFFVVFNLIFVVIGALCIGFVIWLRQIEIVDLTLRAFAADELLFYCGISLGVLLIVVGLFGAFGACYKKKGILVLYLCIILFFVGCELAAIVYAIAEGRHEFESNLEEVWKSVENETKFVIQRTFNCCGFSNASKDWGSEFSVICGDLSSNNTEVVWNIPCRNEIISWLQNNIFVVGGALIATLLFQVFQAIVTCLIIRKINFNNRVDSDDNEPNGHMIKQNHQMPSKPRNSSYNNAGYIQEDSLYDDSRRRNMKIQRQKKKNTSSLGWQRPIYIRRIAVRNSAS